jgi:hypothetical protein
MYQVFPCSNNINAVDFPWPFFFYKIKTYTSSSPLRHLSEKIISRDKASYLWIQVQGCIKFAPLVLGSSKFHSAPNLATSAFILIGGRIGKYMSSFFSTFHDSHQFMFSFSSNLKASPVTEQVCGIILISELS